MSGLRLNWRQDGPASGPTVLLVHALGLDLRLWDGIVPLLPAHLHLIRLDLRGHGQSPVPPPPYRLGMLVRDAEVLLDGLGVRDAVVVGLSLGGLVAQGLAAKRLDLVRALVLSNTAARIGTRAMWDDRAAAVESGGIAAIADGVLARWFPPRAQDGAAALRARAMLLDCPPEGYRGAAAALGGADLITPTSGLRLPALCLAGSDDGATPPDMVRELAALIPGARFELMRGAGHLPPLDQPAAFAQHVAAFCAAIGHA